MVCFSTCKPTTTNPMFQVESKNENQQLSVIAIIKDSRSSHQRCSVKKGVLKNFAKFTEKHLCQSLYFNKVAEACNFIKKETLAQVLSCEFCEIFKNTFFTEHLWATASKILQWCV